MPFNLNRRDFLKSTAAVSMSFAGGCSFLTECEPCKQKYNVLFILSDDQGYGQLGAYSDTFDVEDIHEISVEEANRWGYSKDKAIRAAANCTPNIDKLAKEGVRMLNAYAAPSCVPSRAAFITGKYPQRYGIYDNIDIYENGLPDEAFSLVKLLQKSGYATSLIGKWHLGQKREVYGEDFVAADGKHPLDQGFDYYFGFDRAETTYYDSPHISRNREFGVRTDGYLTDHLTDEAISFIDRSVEGNKPFFTFLSYNAPHNPISKPPEKYCRFTLDTGHEWLDHFYNTIYAMDYGIGKVVQHLKDRGIEEDTLIVFSSDNGASWNFPMPANGALRGYKRQFYEGGHKVPMIFRHKGKITAEQDCRDFVSIMDIIPTVLDISGVSINEGLDIDGISLKGLLYSGQRLDERTFYWAAPMGTSSTEEHRANVRKARRELDGVSVWSLNPPGWCVIRGEWKLVDGGDGIQRLYNLVEDIAEQNDISHIHPDMVKKLKSAYIGWRKGLPEPKMWNKEYWRRTLPNM